MEQTVIHTNQASLPEYDNGFITQIEYGTVVKHPQVHFWHARFDLSYYHDELFEQLNLPFPATLTKAVKKRRAEYLAARYCARQLLAQLGQPAFNLISGHDRAPIWPQNICGSVSHSSHCAIVLAAPQTHNRLIGVDIEAIVDRQNINEITKMIVNDKEIQLLKHCHLPLEQAFTLAFSVKESLYKALYPQVKRFFGFEAAEIIALSLENNEITLALRETLTPHYPAGTLFRGQFIIYPQEILTLIIQ
ncbi:4'-phosphopantetheinyl transferase superfamily protein [Photorhabdus laumondii subsp. laumondii]|uniref:Enterobactin synthase component D n=1 Tax=Photorhabdus laumondii subsp. laumondii TaxID=141679 RepID=A0A6L9JG16_PHOLM|nr:MULTISPECIES: 4'-phosphopantetheinyl transferase superfamily protein [Photorhabdus]AWK40913.1 4-phosphopantetheinyl transferase [Photorhabdus laumondii subsp. laumondii]AXG41721.1 4-phosphopantetheinyl transferase [Photorhabdus laumondii subsp. laumondii]MCC8382982.1 4'-phosphopantetheinyl transferase superfamily protein [Photorhabdus laumondii]MCC8386832.1 4'-phosphopantetheinyl transferase superfamily protein [Photorhabdus laumondii]MCC8411814.1 4'-phosphopantetheinyl transferase superfam